MKNLLKRIWEKLTGKAAAVAAVEAERERQVQVLKKQLEEMDTALRRKTRLVKLTRLEKTRVVKVPERAMKEEDLQSELAVDDEDPMWRAVHQLLDREIAGQVDAVATASGEKRVEAAGGIATLQAFQATLLDYQAKGLKAEKDEAEKEESE